jgi:hypothetical protein
MILILVWLVAMLVGGVWWVRHDVTAYRRFKALQDTADRQRLYARWLVQSFVVLVGGSAICLWLAGGLSPFQGFPEAFAPAHRLFQVQDHGGEDHWWPMAFGLSAGIMLSVAIQWRRLKKMLAPQQGPDAALIPRNRREGMLALLLSINAGFSEELFFRLALPLLLLRVTQSLEVAVAISVICFGLAHAHYGWKGVLATMIPGGFLTLYYLSHGSLMRVMIAHALIDVLAFFVRPALADWLALRKAPQWAMSAS